ncbi:Glycosyl transferase, family 14 [Dillenia turbinata]|uniref:Glycosyl transferase, family 14 n=1 Tax=Dillenia turbinata TaxID=194707 RepID=A0AAN8V5Y1_9MAGN
MQEYEIVPVEEGKDPAATSRANPTRAFPAKVIQMCVLLFAVCITVSVVSIYVFRHFGFSSMVTAMGPMKPSHQAPGYKESRGLDRWIKPLPNLIHTMTDQELFRRASLVPRVKKYPFNRVPKIAFMFLTKGPLPLAPLWERFLKGNEAYYSVYVHSSPSFRADFPPSSVFFRRQIPSQVAEWGRMSLCDAERRLLTNALLDISNEWFVLLSETCIPLYNFTRVYQYINGSRYSFISAFDDPGPFGRGKYNEKMAPDITLSMWRKGSQWFEVNRRLAISIVEDTKYRSKFEEFCRPVAEFGRSACFGDEHYFPTMLTIQAANQLANRSLTWVDWSGGGYHPATFGREDVSEELFKKVGQGATCLYNDQPTSVCFLFARKFAPSALEPLLLLAPTAFGY